MLIVFSRRSFSVPHGFDLLRPRREKKSDSRTSGLFGRLRSFSSFPGVGVAKQYLRFLEDEPREGAGRGITSPAWDCVAKGNKHTKTVRNTV